METSGGESSPVHRGRKAELPLHDGIAEYCTLLCTLGTAMQKIDHAALHSEQQAHLSHSALSTPACGPAGPDLAPPFVHSVRVARMGKGLLGGVEFIAREGIGSTRPGRSALVVPLFLFFQFGLEPGSWKHCGGLLFSFE